MSNCCKDTYKRTLEEVILHIERHRGVPLESILTGLKYAVKLVQDDLALDISHHQWKERK